MDKISDRLFLGNLQAAQNFEALKQNNITHILTVADTIRPFFPRDFTYKVILVRDKPDTNLLRHLPAAIQFIREGVRSGGVLVHCVAGVSRSATCVIAYLMQEEEMSFPMAFAKASQKRPVIFPNVGF